MVSKVRTIVGNEGASAEVIVAPIGRSGNRRDRSNSRKRSSPNTNLGRVVVTDLKEKVVGSGSGKKTVKNGKNAVKGKKTPKDDLVWDSGLKVISPPILIDVPQSLVDVMRSIDRAVVGSVEFSIYVKADVSDIECIVISEEFYVPKQLVSGASVDYNEPPMDGFNAVIHKHPRGVRSFSGTDDEYINQNFTVSILWCDGEFVDATVNYDAGAGIKLQLEGYVYVDDILSLPEVDVTNISVHKHERFVPLKVVGHGMQSFAEVYGYYSGTGELDANGVPVDDDLRSEENEYERSQQSMLRCGME